MKAPILLGGVAAALVSTVALAQAPAPQPRAAKVHTRTEVTAKVQQRFARLDANHDGAITQAEAQSVRAQRGARMFDRLDANKDGAVSRGEFDAMHQNRQKGGMAMHKRGGHRGGMGGHMFAMADANKDGRVTLQEAQSAALRHFDMVDANKDGQVTPQERQQMRQQMRGRMQHGAHQG